MADECPPDFYNPSLHHEYDMSLVSMSTVGTIMGITIGILSMLSYLPQIIKIYNKKSIRGLNIIYICFCTTNQFYAASNAVILNLPKMMACAQVGFFKCYSSLLAMIQICGLWAMFFPIPLLFVLFHNNREAVTNEIQFRKKKIEFRWTVVLFIFTILDVVVVSFVSILAIAIQGPCSPVARNLAIVLGFISGMIVIFQWMPQLYSTYKFKGAGSISVITLVIQAPGGLVNLAFLIFVSKEKFSTWFSFFTNNVQLFILLSMIIYYHLKSKKKKKTSITDDVDSNKIPLLDSELVTDNKIID
ncbi:pq loop repeat protein [Anaeramoeba flamelloides]|uniref:Pq loop repeat protein n=1 Tax=Anaeramoeba flamelloides TaxID=1746091 RepID=A0AAV7ZPH9_9EUKA|nr:pq loop repeat protein [Anaeramoeba flamelloides]KAJ6232810.1 pq loop repeat protein [Anaeramoeba flamelloides]